MTLAALRCVFFCLAAMLAAGCASTAGPVAGKSTTFGDTVVTTSGQMRVDGAYVN